MATPTRNGSGTPGYRHTPVLMAMTALGIYLCYRLAVPFLSSLVWALALAVVSAPVQRWLEAKLKHRNVAALASVLLVGLMVVVPAIFVGQRLVLQAAKGAEMVTAQVQSGEWRQAIDSRPRLALLADRIEREVDLPGSLQTLAAWLTGSAKSIVAGSVVQVIGFLLTFYLLFFFLRDRHTVLRTLRSLAPLSNVEMDRLMDRVGDTICATIYGTLAVSAIQGLLGGLMFWWLGLSAPLLWGVVMAVLAVVPVLGAFVVWVPAAAFLALDGHWGAALILALWGLIVVSGIDNLLRPLLVGNRLNLHVTLAFMSVVGGLIVFGASGLILGPVVLTITAGLLDIWRNRAAAETVAKADASPGTGGSPLDPGRTTTHHNAGQ
jgi:predicted PurR-regulated permease PerM